MRNTTYSYDMKEVLQDRINNAKVFSEGNVFLEKTLLKLWDEGYSTTACCAGHPVEENENYYYPNDPNISLRYNEDNYEDIVRLLSSVDLNNLKDLSVASNKVLHLTGVKNKTNEFFNDLNKKFDEYEERVDALIKSTLEASTEQNTRYDVNITFKNGTLDDISLTTDNQQFISKLVDIYEYDTYEYDGKTYYTFKFKDLGFLRNLGFLEDRVIS